MILVTGATGSSGGAIVRELAQRGASFRVLVRSAARAAEASHLQGVARFEGDMGRPASLARALDGVDTALVLSSSTPEMADVQTSFVDGGKRAGVRFVVKFSGKESGIGFDQTRFRFTRMHREVEEFVESSGMAWTHVQPNQFMQVYLREVPAIAAAGALRLPVGNGSLSP